jgi:YVTN family beta-propeller protein
LIQRDVVQKLILGGLMALVFLLTACPRPLTTGMPTTSSPVTASEQVEGLVDFGPRVQATVSEDIAPGATVSLIDVESGHTVASTRTDSRGRFILTYSNGFHPENGKLYYFEAVKGLRAGSGHANAAGGDAVRIRTIAQFTRGGWATLANRNVGTTIRLNRMTTALAVVISLRSTTNRPIDASTLMGAISVGDSQNGYPDSLSLGDPNLVTTVQQAFDLVDDSLAKERDPLYWIKLDESAPMHDALTLPDVFFSIAYLSPSTAAALETIDLVGSNFASPASRNKVYFQTIGGNVAEADVVAVNTEVTRLTVRVPANAINGPVQVTIDDQTLNGPPFRLKIRDGHSVVDPAGNVYVVNQGLGTVAIIERIPGTDRTGVRSLVSGLTQPSALTFAPDSFEHLYVACGGASPKVWKIDLATQTKVAYHAAGTVPNPSGMAFHASTGALYLTDSVLDKLYVISAQGGSVQEVPVTGIPLKEPRGLSFGPDGRLYVANAGSDSVVAIDPLTQVAAPFAGGLSRPWGLAFDNLGNFYVSNFLGNSIYRMPVTSDPGITPPTYGPISSFASIPTPAGLDADPSGYVYVADRQTNGIHRINPLSQSRQIGYGISYPTSIWVDASGKYVLTQSGNVLKIDPFGNLSLYAYGLSAARGLVKDSAGMLYTLQKDIDALTQVRPDGSSMVVLTGLEDADNATPMIRNDKVYLRSRLSYDDPDTIYSGQGEVQEFNLASLGAPTRRLRALHRGATALARDASGGAYDGWYYLLHGQEGSIVRTRRLGTGSRTEPVVTDKLRLKNPQDLWVDGTGRIWVADYAGASGNGGLYVYSPDGTLDKDYSASVNKPTHLYHDGEGLYVNSHVAAGDIRRIAPATGTVMRTIGGFNLPRGFAASENRTTLYVNEWGLNRISKLVDYRNQFAPITAFIAAEPSLNDLEVRGDYLLRSWTGNSNRIYQTNLAGPTITDIFVQQYGSIPRMFREADGKVTYLTSGGIMHDDSTSFSYFGIGLETSSGQSGHALIEGVGMGAGTLTATKFFAYGRNWLIEQAADGSWSNGVRISQTLTGLAPDGDDATYVNTESGRIYRLIDATLTQVPDAAPDTSFGLFLHGGKLYQTIYDLHRVEEVDPTTGTRTALPVGLATPEI